jgi:anaerobic magnesium-protoporphyrin IX monomethyl ester cyclase
LKVLFVYSLENVKRPGKPLHSWSCMQHGISYISSLLKAHGHQTSLVVLGSNLYQKSLQLMEGSLQEFDPDLVCFTSVYSQYDFMEKIARFAKTAWPGKYLVSGGVHTTLQPEQVIAGPFDAACIGEGEFPLLELCAQLQTGKIPEGIANLWIKAPDGRIEKNPPRDFLADLDALPLPDYAMWERWIDAPQNDELTVFAGRGCPYDCTYCSNHALRKVAGGRYVRTRSPEQILREVRYLHDRYPQRRIYFEIETLDCNTAWAVELCERLAELNGTLADPISFGSNYRINPRTIDNALFPALKRAGFASLNIGLESGSERVRREVLKRNYSNEDFMKVVDLVRGHGLQLYLYNMIGLPGESLQEHRETVQLNRRCQPDGHHTGIFYPYPGTELHESCLRQGLISLSASTGRMERRQPVIELPEFSKSQIRSAYAWFDYHVYRGYRPLWKILAQVVQIKIDSIPLARVLFRKLTYPLSLLRRAQSPLPPGSAK